MFIRKSSKFAVFIPLQIFTSHGTTDWWKALVYNELNPPIYGQIFKIEPLTGSHATTTAIRVTFRGCGR